jgi:hypothetical protein
VAEAAKVEVIGVDELLRGLRRLFADISQTADEEFEAVVDRKASGVSGDVPRLSGRLAASVISERMRGGARVGMGGPGVPYAGWIEFGGTRGRPYYPQGRYLFPISLAAEPELKSAGERAASKEIRGFPWPRPRK